MDSIGGAGGFWGFFYFWGFDDPAPGPVLPHLLRDHHSFLQYLHKEDPVEPEGMVFQKMALGTLARIGLRSLNGSKCFVKAGD